MRKCTICHKEITAEDAPILVMGAYGIPKVLCDECSRDLDTVTGGKEYDGISEAMNRLGERMSESSPDAQTLCVVNSILEDAAERAKQIRDGSYDFSLDEEEGENDANAFDEIPEELAETEEDREKDRIDEERNKKFDKYFNWVTIGALIGVALFVIWKILDAYLF